MNRNKPSKIYEWILKKITKDHQRDSVLGDYNEDYDYFLKTQGARAAKKWYRKEVLNSLLPFIINKFTWGVIMVLNHIKTAFRNFIKYKVFSSINVAGLTIGLAVSMIVFVWIQDELSFDDFHQDGENIYRVISKIESENKLTLNARTPDPLAPTLAVNFPDVKYFTRYQSFERWPVKYKDKVFGDEVVAVADKDFFKMFDFQFIKGNKNTVFDDLLSAVITESLAKKIFGNDDPIGEVISMAKDYKVVGVIKDLPENSHIKFDFMLPIENMKFFWGTDLADWQRIVFYSYLNLKPNVNVFNFEDKIKDQVKEYDKLSKSEIFLQPLEDIHLHSNFEWDLDNYKKGNILYVYILSFVSVSVLLIACFNFVSLTTTRAVIRGKEIAVKKVTGASKKELISQFFTEVLFLTFVSMILAIVLVILVLPQFNEIANKQFQWQNLLVLEIIIPFIVLTVITALFAGAYPALYLSSLNPILLFRKTLLKNENKNLLKKILVTGQFVLTIIFLIVTIAINKQMNFIKDKDLGFNKDHILYTQSFGSGEQFESIKASFLSNPNILKVTNSIPPVNSTWGTKKVSWEGKTPNDNFLLYPVPTDYEYLSTFEMEMAEGRFFNPEIRNDANNFVLNETAINLIGLKDPIGKRFSYNNEDFIIEGNIIGIIKDYHHSSLHNPIEPIFLSSGTECWITCFKIKPTDVEETIQFIKSKWLEYDKRGRPFIYNFIDDEINKNYQTEAKLITVLNYSTVMCFCISFIGLFALVSFSISQRTKEISIRKVLGAKLNDIIGLISKQFLLGIVISNIIAWPVASLIIDKLFEDYAFKTEITYLLFVMAALFVLLFTLFILSIQISKTVSSNPANGLRSE